VLVDFLRPRRLLLVLDNCEHLVKACAELAEALLKACPRLQILATSREPLHVAGERAWRLTPLKFEQDRSASISQLLDCDATRLDDRFHGLVGGCRATAPRHHTLRATIDWSYDLLSTAEQALLCRVSAFTGGWTLEAAEAVCSGDGIATVDILDHLSGLVDKSLVVAEPGAGGQARYRLLQSVRQYAQERLRTVENATDGVLRRHCAYYRQLAQAVETHSVWGTGGPEWLARLDLEQNNLRAALAWSVSVAGDVELGLELAAHLDHVAGARAEFARAAALLDESVGGYPNPARTRSATPARLDSGDEEVKRLTPREREVAALIARGLTNREIAEALVVALRTASNHVEHILDKLSFHSRSQIAAWATQHRLVSTEVLRTQAA
jgi:predicted ATPase/DNA-binding CsgD family transcriptional regulator